MSNRISPQELARLGWQREGPYLFVHSAGWVLRHCRHPTAHFPWMLYDPAGFMILTGAAGELKNPDFGTCWSTLRAAADYVSIQIKGEKNRDNRT